MSLERADSLRGRSTDEHLKHVLREMLGKAQEAAKAEEEGQNNQISTMQVGMLIKSKTVLDDRHNRWIIYQLLRALAYVHGANVSHRDVKPDNVVCQQANWLASRLAAGLPVGLASVWLRFCLGLAVVWLLRWLLW